MDGRLVEVALSPSEATGVRVTARRMRMALTALRKLIAGDENFSGDAALKIIDEGLRVAPTEPTR